MKTEVVILVEAAELRSDTHQIVSSYVCGKAKYALARNHVPTQNQTSRNIHDLYGGGSNVDRLYDSEVAPHWVLY